MLHVFFFNDTATTEIYTLSLHDALPISSAEGRHLDDLAPDQLDPIGRFEDPHLAHPVVLHPRSPRPHSIHFHSSDALPSFQHVASPPATLRSYGQVVSSQ